MLIIKEREAINLELQREREHKQVPGKEEREKWYNFIISNNKTLQYHIQFLIWFTWAVQNVEKQTYKDDF